MDVETVKVQSKCSVVFQYNRNKQRFTQNCSFICTYTCIGNYILNTNEFYAFTLPVNMQVILLFTFNLVRTVRDIVLYFTAECIDTQKYRTRSENLVYFAN